MDSSTENFCLKWGDFQSDFTDGFRDLLQEEAMVDVTIAADGHYIQAHKVVLSVCSTYFKDLFKVNPCKHPIVILKDVNQKSLSSMLDFMYKGEVEVSHDDLQSFLGLASTLCVKGVSMTGQEVQVSENDKRAPKLVTRVRKKRVRPFSPETDSDAENDESFRRQRKPKKRRSKASKRSLQTDLDAAAVVVQDNVANEAVSAVPDDGHNSDSTPLAQLVTAEEVRLDVGSAEMIKEDSSEDDFNDGGNDDLDMDESYNPAEDALAKQVPQAVMSKPGASVIWNYFHRYRTFATCKMCGKSFRGVRPHSSIETHLRSQHSDIYATYVNAREKQRMATISSYKNTFPFNLDILQL